MNDHHCAWERDVDVDNFKLIVSWTTCRLANVTGDDWLEEA